MAKRCPRCLEQLTPVNECVCPDDDEQDESPELTPKFQAPPWPEDAA